MRFVTALVILVAACGCVRNAPSPNASFWSDARAVRSTTNDRLVLRKTLDGYKTFGGYDVAYTGQTAQWSFAVPAANVRSAELVLSMDADDHATSISEYRYTLRSGARVLDTPSPLPHGAPVNAAFDNWVEVAVPAHVDAGGTFTVSLTNTSAAAPLDWIAVRWIELRLEITR